MDATRTRVRRSATRLHGLSNFCRTNSYGAMHDDCPGHVKPAAGTTEIAASGEASPCPTCASCQVCSSVALAFASVMSISASFGEARPAPAKARFASADRAPGFKPPIS